MKKLSPAEKQQLKSLQSEIKQLQADLVVAKKKEGKDDNIDVRVLKNQARFKRVKQKGVEDKAFGMFYIEVRITAKQADVYVPLSIASGKKTAGLMYQIEGEREGSIVTAEVRVQGEDVTQVKVGTLLFAKVPAGSSGVLELRITIRGSFGKAYRVIITRLNYKLQLADVRYQQYIKEISSRTVTLS